MRVTVIDVAKAAGVSRTTVSNVLGGKGNYSDETRDAVIAAAKKLGYKPNLAARSLITNRSRLIGLILPSYVDTNTLTNSPFYNIIMDSVYSVLRLEAYYDLILFSVPYKEILLQVNDWIDARNVDGILAVGEYERPFMQELNAKQLPVVLIDNYAHDNFVNFSYVNSDDETGGYLATRHLVEKGYQKIALCSVELDSPLMQKRYQGYKRAMKEAGYKEHAFDKTGIPFEAGLQFADSLSAQQFEAAFCTEDMVAVGLVHGMLKMGVQVGPKFGVVGFDNSNIGRQISPELTTIDQNIFEKGETAARTLLKIINNQVQRGSRLILPVSLVVRETA
ncbi:MAG: LacI family DNA-binding transcriptional regulator [Anaerolineales bacterium]|nr:LacI family DNA-binding transcriptional regulator [Anaerolineales bacterium]